MNLGNVWLLRELNPRPGLQAVKRWFLKTGGNKGAEQDK